jgi:pyruvate/2-oxoglutarate dehydrogenase complex dihydrolipoamide acyltransferase (E2) component
VDLDPFERLEVGGVALVTGEVHPQEGDDVVVGEPLGVGGGEGAPVHAATAVTAKRRSTSGSRSAKVSVSRISQMSVNDQCEAPTTSTR